MIEFLRNLISNQFFQGTAGFFGVFFVLFAVIVVTLVIVLYALRSVGLYTIAKRRGIRHGWVCWLPLGDVWIQGSIADQYLYVAKGKVRNYRKILAASTILMALLSLGLTLSTSGTALGIISEGGVLAGAALAFALIFRVLIFVISLILQIGTYIVMYHIFASCNAKGAILYFLLSFFVPMLYPIFIYSNRIWDMGMPPRKEAVTAEEIPEAPVEAIAEEIREEEPAEETPEEVPVEEIPVEESAPEEETNEEIPQ